MYFFFKKIESEQRTSEDPDQLSDIIGQMDKYADIEQEFDEHFQQSLQNNTFDINNHDAYRKLLRWIDDDDHHESEQNISDDVEMMESEEFTIPIDPICRTEINIPIRNKQCGHLYDKENLFNLFRNNRFVIIVEKNDLLKKNISYSHIFPEQYNQMSGFRLFE